MARPKQSRLCPAWTADLAYVVGLITTDGNLSPDGRHLELVSKDLEQIQCLKTLLKLTNRITQKSSTFSQELCYRIQFGNVALYEWLLSIGLMPNKSMLLGQLAVPDEYFFDFLRGHLDGDGNLHVYDDPVYPNSKRLYTAFHSASLAHLEWIQSMTARLVNVDGYIGEGSRVWTLRYAKADSLVLLSRMYYHVEVPCLKRKRGLVEMFL